MYIVSSIEIIEYNAFEYDIALQYNEYGGAKYLGNTLNQYAVLMRADTATSINENTRIIYENAFVNSDIENIIIPDSVVYIGDGAFWNCKIEDVKFGSSLLTIANSAFAGCSNLTCIAIPETVKNIGDYAFFDCELLANITLQYGVERIGSSAFAYCQNLSSIELPDGVSYIGDYAFAFCSNLKNITIGTGTQSYWDFLQGCPIEYVRCPASMLHHIPQEHLVCVVISSGTAINIEEFKNCSTLTSITIPTSVHFIYNAFMGCVNLVDINYEGTIAEWNSMAISQNWDIDTGNYIIHCKDGDILKGA